MNSFARPSAKLAALSLAWIATALLSLSATAATDPEKLKAILEAQPDCQQFVRFDEQNLYLGFGRYRDGFEEPRHAIPGKFRVAPLDGSAPFELATKDAAIDIVVDSGHAFVLTFSSLEEWDLAKRERVAEHPTYAFSGQMAFMQHPQAMARYRDKVVIAHGRLGVSFFDLKTRRLVNQFRLLPAQLPYESMAMGVTIQGNRAYLVLSNYHMDNPEKGVTVFRGLVTIDMETEKVVSELGGLDPGADSAVSDGHKLIVSFGGIPIWKYRLASLEGRELPQPENRIWQFPLKSNPTGAPALDGKYYYTCFSTPTGNHGSYRNVPVALSRHDLKLD